MSLTLSNIMSRVNRKIQNAKAKLGGDAELIEIINEAQREVQSRVDLISAKRKGTPRYIMSNIFEYPLDEDTSYDKYIEAEYSDQSNSLGKSTFQRMPAKFFFNAQNPYLYNGYGGGIGGWSDNRGIQNPITGSDFQKLAIEFDNGNPYLMVRMIGGKPTATLNTCNTVTENGTWGISEDADEIRTNNQSYTEGSGSIEFLTRGGIDQEQLTQDSTVAVGESDLTTKYNKLGQSFVAETDRIESVTLYKKPDTGTFLGDVTISLYADSGSDEPTGLALATKTILNADWGQISDNDIFEVTFTSPYTMTPSDKYWIVLSSSTADDANHFNVGANSSGGYSNGSLRFNNTIDGWSDVTGYDLYFIVNTGYTNAVIKNSTMTAVDLSDYEYKGICTLDIELPSTKPTSITLRWGSDSSNYWEATATTKQNGLNFNEGWNTVSFNWVNATQTGTVDNENITYLMVIISNDTATSNLYRLDNIVMRLTRQCEISYYSKYLVIGADGTRKENFTNSDDTTILQEKEVNMLVWAASKIANQQLRQYNEADVFENELTRMINEYKLSQPSQEEPATNSYYII